MAEANKSEARPAEETVKAEETKSAAETEKEKAAAEEKKDLHRMADEMRFMQSGMNIPGSIWHELTENEFKDRRPGRVHQMHIYFKKLMRLFIYQKDWRLLIFAAIIAVLVAKVVGSTMFVTMEGTLIGSLAVTCICLWNGVFNSVQVVCRERAVIKREHRTGMHIVSYLMAHILVQAIICALQVVLTMAVFDIFGIKSEMPGLLFGSFRLDFFVTMFLITFASDMMGIMVSCIVRNTTAAMTVMPLLLIVQLVFAGVAFPLHGIMAKVSDFTLSKWGVCAICTEANYNALPSSALWTAMQKISGQQEGVAKFLAGADKSRIMEITGRYVQDASYTYSVSNVLQHWGILIAFAVGFAVLGLIFLEFIDHDKR